MYVGWNINYYFLYSFINNYLHSKHFGFAPVGAMNKWCYKVFSSKPPLVKSCKKALSTNFSYITLTVPFPCVTSYTPDPLQNQKVKLSKIIRKNWNDNHHLYLPTTQEEQNLMINLLISRDYHSCFYYDLAIGHIYVKRFFHSYFLIIQIVCFFCSFCDSLQF